MQYMLLIYDDERQVQGMGEDEAKAFIGAYFAYTNELREAGAYVAGDALQPTATARTVHVRDDEAVVTDGPFAETKEQLGGYYLVDVESEDEALEWAAKIPSARLGRIEVRPLMVFPATVEA